MKGSHDKGIELGNPTPDPWMGAKDLEMARKQLKVKRRESSLSHLGLCR